MVELPFEFLREDILKGILELKERERFELSWAASLEIFWEKTARERFLRESIRGSEEQQAVGGTVAALREKLERGD